MLLSGDNAPHISHTLHELTCLMFKQPYEVGPIVIHISQVSILRSQRLSNLPKVTQILSGRARILIHAKSRATAKFLCSAAFSLAHIASIIYQYYNCNVDKGRVENKD